MLYHVLFCNFAISSQICKAFLGLGTGHKVQRGAGVRRAMKNFFLSTGFQWPTPQLFDKIGAAHPPTKTSNADVDRYIREHWLTTCQLSANSLQAAIPECDSEEEPLKPTDRQAINHKIKRRQDLKEKSEKLKSSIQKENAQRSLKSLGKSSVGKSVGNASMKNAWE